MHMHYHQKHEHCFDPASECDHQTLACLPSPRSLKHHSRPAGLDPNAKPVTLRLAGRALSRQFSGKTDLTPIFTRRVCAHNTGSSTSRMNRLRISSGSLCVETEINGSSVSRE